MNEKTRVMSVASAKTIRSDIALLRNAVIEPTAPMLG